MKHYAKSVALLVFGSLVFAGCSLLGGGESTQKETPQPTEATSSVVETNPFVVTYKDGVFSPNLLKVRVGETVVFKNEGPGVMWVGSNPHPIHTDYSEFDARRGYAVGESYSFTFTKVGNWGYHNHRSAGDTGLVEVSE